MSGSSVWAFLLVPLQDLMQRCMKLLRLSSSIGIPEWLVLQWVLWAKLFASMQSLWLVVYSLLTNECTVGVFMVFSWRPILVMTCGSLRLSVLGEVIMLCLLLRFAGTM